MSEIQHRADSLDASKFYGVPIAGLENAGRQQFILLLMAGLEPQSKVLDVGCGVLRAGYWLIHFLDPHCYYGIEPHQERLETGRSQILEPDVERTKHPHFDTNAAFDSGVFDTKFDFFLAYSIWTHASKPQIEVMLDNFLRDSNPDAAFLTSILPAIWPNDDYRGEKWFGTSHESTTPGCIRHSLKWIEAASRRRGLQVVKLGRERDGQTWLQVARDARSRLLFRTIWGQPRLLRAAERLFR